MVVGEEEADGVAGAREAYFDARAAPPSALRGGASATGEVLATGPFDWPVRRAVAEGALLVGDAAGYYDPFTGQGIYRALRGAELAAEAADAALRARRHRLRALLPYERARRRAFAPGERLQHVIEAFLSRPRLLAWAGAAAPTAGPSWRTRSSPSPETSARCARSCARDSSASW